MAIFIGMIFPSIVAFDSNNPPNISSESEFICIYATEGENHPPYEPSNPHPEDGAINVPISILFNWTGGDPDIGDIVTYDVYLGTSIDAFIWIYSIMEGEEYMPEHPLVDDDTTYYWKIVAWDNHGASTEGPIWSFTTIGENIPEIEIEISGGLGVNAVIENIGDIDITDLEWSITITGGLFDLINEEVNGIISHLAIGEEKTISSGNFFGLGSIDVTVIAGAEETIDGRQFIIFTKIVEK